MRTWNILWNFGFQIESGGLLGGQPVLRAVTPELELAALFTSNQRRAPVALINGVLNDRGHFCSLRFEIPAEVASIEQCAAYLARGIDGGDQPVFYPREPLAWLDLGRCHQHLHPLSSAAGTRQGAPTSPDSRSHCLVARSWLRLALARLRSQLKHLDGGRPVSLYFDGLILTISAADSVRVEAAGDAWQSAYCVPAGTLRRLPRRLTSDPVCVGVWDSRLRIDHYAYSGVEAIG
jgi:hypothetical protein